MALPYRSETARSEPIFQLPANLETAKVFTPFKLSGGVTLKNRVVKAATFGGGSVDELIRHHGEIAAGGVAMTTIAYTSISQNGRTFANQLVIEEEQMPELIRLTTAVHEAGSLISVQITHAGSFSDRALIGETQIAPSSVFNTAGLDFPREMDEKDIENLVNDFVRASEVAKKSGFDAIELHCGHGYLLSQFLSPHTNRRSDKWGGSVENRLRLPLLVFKRIKEALGADYPVLIKMNTCDGFSGGLELPHAIENAKAFAAAGADALVLSGGFVSLSGFYMLRGDVPLWDMFKATNSFMKKVMIGLFGVFFVPHIWFGETFFRDEARAILKEVDVPVCLLGGVSSLASMEGAINEGFSFVQMGRTLIREPQFLQRIKKEFSTENPANIESKCIHCNQCVVSSLSPSPGGVICPERTKDIEDIVKER